MPKKCRLCSIKQSHYNSPHEKQALYCCSCKFDDMIDVVSKKCVICNLKQPNSNYPNEKKHFSVRIVNNVI